MSAIIKPILDELERLGCNWTIEPGGKHQHLRIDGKLVTVLPYGKGRQTGSVTKNVIAAIRRAVRRQK